LHILLCGGAGYIGSHMAKLLHESGFELTVLDNLSTGHREAVKWGNFVEADIRDAEALDKTFSDRKIDAVMHFSAKSLVGESVEHPEMYFDNNVVGSKQLLDAMQRHGISKFIYSSTAAVYGMPENDAIAEDHQTTPINPYGETKLAVEHMLQQYADIGIRSVALRYFNAAGADASGDIGEAHNPETHLIPNILKSALSAGDLRLKIFGTDYPTPDGTCVRDYIHVSDLAEAHLLALKYLDTAEGFNVFNLGSGEGFSVKEVLNSCEQVLGEAIAHDLEERRPGDPPILVANSDKARTVLAWQPKYENLETIVGSALNWHKKQAY
jgi:UDP-glucose 4-epimerase